MPIFESLFANERFDEPRCQRRRAKLVGKVTRFLKWTKKITKEPNNRQTIAEA